MMTVMRDDMAALVKHKNDYIHNCITLFLSQVLPVKI
jgi:hypothetical protein